MKKLLLAVITALTITSCGSMYQMQTKTFFNSYTKELISVERPESSVERYGEYTVSTQEEDDVTKYFYSDEMIEGTFVLGLDHLSFVIQNKTEHSIKVIWDGAAYISSDGYSQGIMHKGVKYNEKSNSQRPSIITKGNKLSDLAQPIDNVYYDGGYYGRGWVTNPIFEYKSNNGEDLKKLAQETIGKRVSFLLPLEIEGIVNEYTFTFEVTDAKSTLTIIDSNAWTGESSSKVIDIK